MRTVVRKGQKTWYGRTKSQVLLEAARIRGLARQAEKRGNSGDREIAYRQIDNANFLEHNAKRMAND